MKEVQMIREPPCIQNPERLRQVHALKLPSVHFRKLEDDSVLPQGTPGIHRDHLEDHQALYLLFVIRSSQEPCEVGINLPILQMGKLSSEVSPRHC